MKKFLLLVPLLAALAAASAASDASFDAELRSALAADKPSEADKHAVKHLYLDWTTAPLTFGYPTWADFARWRKTDACPLFRAAVDKRVGELVKVPQDWGNTKITKDDIKVIQGIHDQAVAVLNESFVGAKPGSKLDNEKADLAAKIKALKDQLDALDKKAEKDKKGDEPARGRGYVAMTPERLDHLKKVSLAKHGNRIRTAAQFLDLPAAFDCNDKIPLPMWDQGPCGSCYEVSTVRTATCAGLLVGLGKPDGSYMLAAQYGMDRPRNFGGCGGGNGTEVIDWMVKNGWIAESWVDEKGAVHKDYPPYEARSGSDRTKPGARVWAKGWDWGFTDHSAGTFKSDLGTLHLAAPSVDMIKACMFLHGRQNVALDAGGQFSNGSGTITRLGASIDHEINVRAYDDNHDNGDGTKGAFLLENQWGEGWGNKGCRWCSYGASRNIVDWFFVSAGTGPTPPPPPPPPGQLTVAVADVAGQPAKAVKFLPIVTGGTGTYLTFFQYGDGASDTTGSHTYAANGTYKVTVTAVDSGGNTGSATCAATISDAPPPPSGGLSLHLPQDTPKGMYNLVLPSQLDEIQRQADALQRQLDAIRGGGKAKVLPKITDK